MFRTGSSLTVQFFKRQVLQVKNTLLFPIKLRLTKTSQPTQERKMNKKSCSPKHQTKTTPPSASPEPPPKPHQRTTNQKPNTKPNKHKSWFLNWNLCFSTGLRAITLLLGAYRTFVLLCPECLWLHVLSLYTA